MALRMELLKRSSIYIGDMLNKCAGPLMLPVVPRFQACVDMLPNMLAQHRIFRGQEVA